jgi:hypothetical protein
MIRNLKTLGVALCAVLALSAFVASAASAVSYTAASYPTTGTGESPVGNDTFKTEAGNVECKSHFEGTLTAASTSLTVKAKYTECKAFGFASATVSMGSCHYLFTEGKFLESTETKTVHDYTSVVHVICTKETEPITISASTCKATVGGQSPGGHGILTVTTAKEDVAVRAAVTGIKYTVTEDGFLCPFNGTGAKTGATYTQDNPVTFDSTNGAKIDVG